MRISAAFLAAALTGTAHAIPALVLLHRAGPNLPSKDSFYFPTGDLSGHQPGAILQQRPPPAAVAAFGLVAAKLNRTQQLLYRTSDAHGRPIATVATILIPHNSDLGKLLSYQIAVDAASIELRAVAEFLLIEAALHVAGAAVGGTVPDVASVIKAINGQPLAGFIPTGVLGLVSQYPEAAAPVNDALKPEEKQLFYSPLKPVSSSQRGWIHA